MCPSAVPDNIALQYGGGGREQGTCAGTRKRRKQCRVSKLTATVKPPTINDITVPGQPYARQRP
eukprot:3842437-Prymnesium_polylepis.1